jgi:hypothetical protein
MAEPPNGRRVEWSIALGLTLLLQLVVAVGLVVFVARREWPHAFFAALTIALTVVPAMVSRRLRLFVPPELQLVAVAFVFFSEFLGSAQHFYDRFWWWDSALHLGAGVLMGVAGMLVVLLLYRTTTRPPNMPPVFFCLFAFTFSVTLGVMWEIYEFTIDRLVPGMNAQHAETGVVDTMKDLIVDTVGAALVAGLGWIHLHTGRFSFLVDVLRDFVRRNPRWFHPRGPRAA